MRARLATLIALGAICGSFSLVAPTAHAAPWTSDGFDRVDHVILAQQGQESEETDQPSEEAPAEEGPPWTYQMARLALLMLVLTAIGVFAAYWKFVYTRKRSGA